MLHDAMIFGGGMLAGWLTMAGFLWVACVINDRKYRDED